MVHKRIRIWIRELHIKWILRTETTKERPLIMTPELAQLAKDAAALTNMTSEQAFDRMLEELGRYNRDQG